jgi:hypothetical protein
MNVQATALRVAFLGQEKNRPEDACEKRAAIGCISPQPGRTNRDTEVERTRRTVAEERSDSLVAHQIAD